MTERDKLLPCPFCGSEPRHLEFKAGECEALIFDSNEREFSHLARITRLEAANAEARELLTNAVRLSATLEGAELYSAINSFLAKQGD